MDPTSPQVDAARARLMTERAQRAALIAKLDDEHAQDGPIDTLGGDAAADTTNAAAILGVRDDLIQQIEEIDAALKRVDDGTYGIDELTGEPIDPARLEAIPTARTNI